jgi:hypothetical protein
MLIEKFILKEQKFQPIVSSDLIIMLKNFTSPKYLFYV